MLAIFLITAVNQICVFIPVLPKIRMLACIPLPSFPVKTFTRAMSLLLIIWAWQGRGIQARKADATIVIILLKAVVMERELNVYVNPPIVENIYILNKARIKSFEIHRIQFCCHFLLAFDFIKKGDWRLYYILAPPQIK